MATNAEQCVELERISALLVSLSAEKARIDAEIAATTEQLRELFEERLLDTMYSSESRAKEECIRQERRKTNIADTTTATEIACLLRISERAAHRLVQHSALLVNHHPRTLSALRGGEISWNHASALLHEYAGLPHGTAALVEDRLLPIAVTTTVSRLAYRARKLRTEVHPDALEGRRRAASLRRRVDFEPADDAMAWLHVLLDATDATAIDARLTRLARTLEAPEERRTLPQLRTDVLTDLLLDDAPSEDSGWSADRAPYTSDQGDAVDAAGPGRVGAEYHAPVRAHINVTVPVLTLLAVDDAPADLEGYGPIPADIARRLAAHAPSFTRLLTHPETGAVLSVGRSSYAVPADLKKWLRVRDRTCRHPGCSVPASRCELDHTRPWSQGGPTSHDNLAHLCRKHHMLKSEGIWHYEQEDGGVLTATSPAGAVYECGVEAPPG
ncbi:DUF222 domain-containing protein [Arthrobacter echini]|uniref:DUF222 domain-containing protein n=1 Tax=Arthrobacter echini TaxID=1529066 RepID=A0A4S5E444_9MICC|nr:HNH endonuclease signature motif containing protein [Arthrobacter echini]THJ66218.1 DUF222 domain-containing protein [Arthrobacter echini]